MALASLQVGHFVEHVAQMVQIHVFGLEGAQARGIVGALDIEWVHFVWNTLIIIGVLALLPSFRRSGWLWIAAMFCAWHSIEHVYIMAAFLNSGAVGGPGLLARGGILGGGVPLSRPDLHFLYNLAETIPLCLAAVVRSNVVHQRAPRSTSLLN